VKNVWVVRLLCVLVFLACISLISFASELTVGLFARKGWTTKDGAPITIQALTQTGNGSPSPLRLIARKNKFVCNERGAAFDLMIAPAWYQTNWLLAACIIAGLLLVWTLHEFRMRQMARALDSRFDERLAERMRIARELHDKLLQTIEGSKMVADDALDAPTDPARMRHALEQLSLWLDQATQEEWAALNSLRVSTIETDDLAEAFRRAIEDCQRRGFIGASFSVSGQSRQMHPAVRDEVYRIGYEAIRNACVHSHASRLDVELIYAQDLTLRVADNGIGFDPVIADRGEEGHYGLRGMRERAARIAAKLTVSTSIGSGTEITIVVPEWAIFSHPAAAMLKKMTAIIARKSKV
jgi:signal transduction histidine kinase